MMNCEESGVISSPVPEPISSLNDLLIPALAVLSAWVLSSSRPRAAATNNAKAPRGTATNRQTPQMFYTPHIRLRYRH